MHLSDIKNKLYYHTKTVEHRATPTVVPESSGTQSWSHHIPVDSQPPPCNSATEPDSTSSLENFTAHTSSSPESQQDSMNSVQFRAEHERRRAVLDERERKRAEMDADNHKNDKKYVVASRPTSFTPNLITGASLV